MSKTKSEDDIMELYQCGVRHFGENRIEELLRKSRNVPKEKSYDL